MLNESDLRRELNSLDMLINALSYELTEQLGHSAQNGLPNRLIKEMEEALFELRQARGLKKMLLNSLENGSDAKGKREGRRASRRTTGLVHSSIH